MPIHYLSKSSSFIILGIHEGCSHWASCFYSFLYQDHLLFDSIKINKEVLIDLSVIKSNEVNFNHNIMNLLKNDGGDVLELILFGRKLTYFSLNEILFLLCKNSYNVDYKTFRINFEECQNKSLELLYDKATKDTELLNLMKTFNINFEYFKSLRKKNNLNFSFKRNGNIINNSRCEELTF